MICIQCQSDVFLSALDALKTALGATEKMWKDRATVNRGRVLSSIMINCDKRNRIETLYDTIKTVSLKNYISHRKILF